MDNEKIIQEKADEIEEKKKDLYDRQVDTLKKFLERKVISQQQYDKSFHDLTEKMGFVK